MLDANLSTLQVQLVLTRQMDMLADNLANVATPGFKNEMLAVSAKRIRLPGGQQLIGQPMTLERNMDDGAFTQTGNPLDLAIKGSGFFVVQTPLGDRYTRNGHFQIDSQGQLVSPAGYPVLSDPADQVPADRHRYHDRPGRHRLGQAQRQPAQYRRDRHRHLYRPRQAATHLGQPVPRQRRAAAGDRRACHSGHGRVIQRSGGH